MLYLYKIICRLEYDTSALLTVFISVCQSIRNNTRDAVITKLEFLKFDYKRYSHINTL